MKLKQHVRRFDLGELQSVTRTPQGFLKCPAFATRCGVFPYLDANGKVRRELRHPDDVLDPVSLATLKSAPVTIEHPPEMVTPANVGKYSVGHLTDRVEVNRDLVDVDVIVEDQEAIDAVEKEGIRELSSGYDCDVIEESGDYNGTPYDFRQKNIIYNHVAMVKRGRAGPEVRLRMDSADAVMQAEGNQEPLESVNATETGVMDAEQVKTKKVVILGREVDLPSDVADTIQDLTDRYDEMRAKQSLMEESFMSTKANRKDVDINQPGVSPQVKVEQQTPDGKSAPGKTPAMPGTVTGGPTAKADDENEDSEMEEEKKEDGEKEEDEKKDDEPASEKGGGASESNVDKLKKDYEESKAKLDADFKSKMDAFAAASDDKKPAAPNAAKMDSADVQKAIRARVKLERQAEKLVPFEVSKRFDSMSDKQILAATIKHRAPKADLEGKSLGYLQQRFDSMLEALEDDTTETRSNAGRALMGIGMGRLDSAAEAADPAAARQKMIASGRELYKQPLSGSKK